MATAKEKEQFLCQVEQAKLVSSQKPGHQNIVAMIGCVTTHEPLCMVMELPANGDLLSYLLFHRRNVRTVKLLWVILTPMGNSCGVKIHH